MHLYDCVEHVNEEVRIAKQQLMMRTVLWWNIHGDTWWDDRRHRVRLRHSRDAELSSRSREADGQCRKSKNHGRNS